MLLEALRATRQRVVVKQLALVKQLDAIRVGGVRDLRGALSQLPDAQRPVVYRERPEMQLVGHLAVIEQDLVRLGAVVFSPRVGAAVVRAGWRVDDFIRRDICVWPLAGIGRMVGRRWAAPEVAPRHDDEGNRAGDEGEDGGRFARVVGVAVV